MDEDQGSSNRILRTLRLRPRGMTITEIAKHTGLTRNSVSKHLEVLRVGGQVDMRTVGNAKVYSLAQRVPMSAFLCFTSNLIVVLDRCGNILQINDRFLSIAGRKKEEILGENVREVALPVVSTPETLALIEGVEREQYITDVRYRPDGEEFFYQMQVVPTVFDHGERGRTIVLEDITEKKRYVRNMEFLAKSAMDFVDLPDDTDVYQRIGELIIEFIPEGKVFVQSYDEAKNTFFVRSVMDELFRQELISLLGRDPVGMPFPLDEVFLSPFLENPGEIEYGVREIPLEARPAKGVFSFYDLAFGQIPEDVCEQVVTTCNIGKAYMTFLVWKGQLLGDVGVFLAADEEIEDVHALESFIRQASIAISKRMTEERLRRSNQRFRQVVELFPFPAAIINAEGRYTFINRKFIEVFGYTLDDIPTGKEWFARAFPDAAVRRDVIATWKKDVDKAGENQVRPRMYEVTCKNGERKTVIFRPILFCDQSHYVTYEDVTELRRAQSILLDDIEDLKAVGEELRIMDMALASLPCAVAVADANRHLRYVNAAFLAMWGYESLDDVAGMDASELWTADGGMDWALDPWSGVVTGLRRDRSSFSVQGTFALLRDDDGERLGLVGWFGDIPGIS
ncbi:hypothetical protein AZH53_04230 [Methanomicrobiaceae archaeon CYW5]|uniref:PAS domain S-box protein n=1 Tax=Methanovulcanius yangii TaxID=1789227 RepID=UPI0029CA9514|nr:PAS domain S-box protein [Methanovulcanius yangii]MBT8507626.1 hypothetical protein [Methanovulcanius yangii]